MRYFHRTSLSPTDVLADAEVFFGQRMQLPALESAPGRRAFRHPSGGVTVEVHVEGGHYTRVTVTTDQLGESEVDKLAKRFLSVVHTRVHTNHEVRGAY